MTNDDVLRAIDRVAMRMGMTRAQMGRMCGAGPRAFYGNPNCRDVARLMQYAQITPRDFAKMMRE